MSTYSDIRFQARCWLKGSEPARSARLRIARELREAHRTDPQMARLVWRRMKAAEERLIAEWVNDGMRVMQGGGPFFGIVP